MAGEGLISVNADSLKQAADAIGEVRRSLGKQDRLANRVVAEKVAGWTQANAAAGTRAQQRFAGAIRPRSTQKVARLALQSTGRNAGANPTFWGARRRTGWNAGHEGRPQFPRWVGNSWTPGVHGQGPYVINDTVATRTPEIGELYADARMTAFRRAFPDGGAK